MEKKIYYHDTDAGGVVYYANYLKYLEESRTELLKEAGVDISKLAGEGILFAVRKVEIEYKAPARYADTLIITALISRIKNATLEFTQTINRGDQILVKANTQLVCINSNFAPQAIPEEVSQCLRKE
ncbi:MAG: YbgC/FadM family acyl-CoA thioesterase [Candidatus Omnitrophica bacterium]|nr:YbgC/FadM family acyl-CoA thioesterase [Candidatus Omnitrophota bacterium]